MDVKYPDITVQLAGVDGNAFSILGRAQQALRRGDVPEGQVKEFMAEAISGDYDHLLATVIKWVDAK